jgi:hypothetical protein
MSDRDDASVILFAEFNGLILGFVIDNDGFPFETTSLGLQGFENLP